MLDGNHLYKNIEYGFLFIYKKLISKTVYNAVIFPCDNEVLSIFFCN